MVSVPVSSRRSVQLTESPRVAFRHTEARDFMGPAIQNAGESMRRAAEQWQQTNEAYDRSDLLAAENAHTVHLTEQKRQFLALRGDEPGKQLPDFLKSAQTHSDDLVNSARSDRSRKLIRRMLNQHNQLAQIDYTAHADVQIKAFEAAELVAGKDLAATDAIAAEDAEQLGIAIGRGLTRLEEHGDLLNLPDSARTLARQEFFDKVHSGRIDKMFAAPDPDVDGIAAYLDQFGVQMSPTLKTETWGRMQGPLQDRQANADADLAQGYAVAPVDGEAPAPVPIAMPKGPEGEVGAELQKAGLSSAVVAGFLGNFKVEGGYGGALGDGGTASGIAQWRHERRANFRRQFGKEPHQASHAEQARFVAWEMANPTKAGMTVAQRDAILNASTAGEAAALIDQYYERSSGHHRQQRIEAAELFGGSGYQSAPREWDRSQLYANLDAVAKSEGWNPERIERARAKLDERVERDEGLLREQRQDADEQATRIVEALGTGFVKTEQIPRGVWNKLSPADQIAWAKVAEANARPVGPEANSDRAMELNLMRFYEPDRFERLNLGHYAGELTRAELDTLLTQQAKMRTGGGQWTPRSGIVTAINYSKKANGLTLTKEDESAIVQIMEHEARQLFEARGKKPLTEDDYMGLFRSATRNVRTVKRGWFSDTEGTIPRYRRSLESMGATRRAQLEERLRRAGIPVTDEALLELYRAEQ